tara:strand:+ start:158 stop:334 length:177 start_codon:yes stop_codon:yes gene_type:complete
METFVIDTNQIIKTQDALLISIAEATVASFNLEGITISIDEAYQMAVASAKRRLKKHK